MTRYGTYETGFARSRADNRREPARRVEDSPNAPGAKLLTAPSAMTAYASRRQPATSAAWHPSLAALSLGALAAVNGPAIADKVDAASIPTGAVYVCAKGTGKNRTIAAIELDEKVGSLCRRHTEMGPCQNARNACRGSGGRVYAADGNEITQANEAEYDKKVMRLRLGP